MTSSLFITHGSPRVMELKAEHDGIIETEAKLRARAREIELEIDSIHTGYRPELPTPDQREGILEALRVIRTGVKPRSHHGDPCAPDRGLRGSEPTQYDVVVDGERGFISVKHLAPYSQSRRGGKLWHWTDPELDALKELLAHEGYSITSEWKHDNGVSLIVAPTASLLESPEGMVQG